MMAICFKEEMTYGEALLEDESMKPCIERNENHERQKLVVGTHCCSDEKHPRRVIRLRRDDFLVPKTPQMNTAYALAWWLSCCKQLFVAP